MKKILVAASALLMVWATLSVSGAIGKYTCESCDCQGPEVCNGYDGQDCVGCDFRCKMLEPGKDPVYGSWHHCLPIGG